MAYWADDDEFWSDIGKYIFADRGDRTAGEVDDLVRLLDLRESQAIVDLACGQGRHVLELARRGFRAHGVDLTSSYIATGSEIAETEGLGATFDVADIRTYSPPEPVDIMLNLWSSFGYFEDEADNQRVLTTARAGLNKGGSLVVQARSKETMAAHVGSSWTEIDGGLFLAEREVADGWTHVDGRWIIVDDKGRRDHRYRCWIYSGQELKSMLLEAGFSSVELYGSLSGAPFSSATKQVVAVATN